MTGAACDAGFVPSASAKERADPVLVYAIAMSRLFRATALMFVLLVESLGSAFALPPSIDVAPPQEHAAMPCHGDAADQAVEAADSAADSMKMPCCGDLGDCRCSVSCFGAASPLAPSFASLVTPLALLPEAAVLRSSPAPAHRLRLLRPPSSLQS